MGRITDAVDRLTCTCHSRSQYNGESGLAVATSVLYVFLAGRYVMRMLSVPELNASARSYFWGVISMTTVLYGICIAIGISQRHRREAPVPVVGAALFGSFICVHFYGP